MSTRGTVAKRLALAATAASLAALLFAAGRWSGAPAPARAQVKAPAPASSWRSPSPTPALTTTLPPAVAPPTPEGPTAAVPEPSSAAPAAPPGELVARVTEQARTSLGVQHAYMSSRCWPADGLPGGRDRATLHFDLTFDRAGREIARGIGEERRAPAGPLARCLRQLPGTQLEVPPPGANVRVRLAVAFP